MRTFILFSEKGATSGNFHDLKQAGRLDIVAHSLISTFYLSNKLRDNIKFHLILNGPPDPPKHIEFNIKEETSVSKKDIGTLLKNSLWKYKQGKKIEAFPGIFIEKKSFKDLLNEYKNQNLYVLDEYGQDISKIKFKQNPVLILGDHEGLPKQERKLAKKSAERISLGPNIYFTSQTITFLNIWLDRAQIE